MFHDDQSLTFKARRVLIRQLEKCYNRPMHTASSSRTKSGQFAPGQSGNPGGRPRDEARVADLARGYTTEAIDTLVDLMRCAKDERVRGTAAQALLDRGWGKARQEIVQEVSGPQETYLDVLKRVNEAVAAKAQD